MAERNSEVQKNSVAELVPFPLPLTPPECCEKDRECTANKFSQDLMRQYFDHPVQESARLLETKPEAYWMKKGQERALALFHAAAARVPAYKDFLKKNRINPDKIKTFEDFQTVPWIDKDNYLRKYTLDQLSWDGRMTSNNIVSVSSGSSGVPMYWPRGGILDNEATFVHEMFMREVFECHKRKTLFINAFAMGMYVAGPLTTGAVLRISQKGYPITLVTPGLEMSDLCRAVIGLMPQHEQVVLAGYAPFIKDVLDTGAAQGIDWKKIRVRFILAGEGFNESWREYVSEIVGQKNSIANDFVNIYGTADAAVVGHETPFSMTVRRLAVRDKNIFSSFFPADQGSRMPTLVQYYPTLKYFEKSDKGEVLFTATAGIPLVRYNIHDRGGVISGDQAREIIKQAGYSFEKEYKRLVDNDICPWNLPLVYVYGKSDFTVTLYGLNVYPENIKLALENPEIRTKVSGRFTISTEYQRLNRNQYLLINVELARGVNGTTKLSSHIRATIVKTLRQVNAEYNKLYSSIGTRRAQPVIKLYSYGDTKHFPKGIKHRWAKKQQ